MVVELFVRVDGADVGVLVERIAHDERAHTVLELADHFVVHAFLHEEAAAGAAHVALVEVDAVDDAFDGLVDGGVCEDDVGRLAAELERGLLAGAGDALLDELAHASAAGEGDLVDARMVDERRARGTRTGDDVDDAIGQFGFLDESRRAAAM
jgi:hypothetical protein